MIEMIVQNKYRKFTTRSCIAIILLFLFSGAAKSQNIQQASLSKRVRENFDFSWQFHKGDIAIKRAVKAGGYGGLTDVNVKVETNKEAVVAYTDVDKAATFKPLDWKEVNLPHDWCVEGTFVNDNSIGSAPAVSGYLPGGVGFYRKEF